MSPPWQPQFCLPSSILLHLTISGTFSSSGTCCGTVIEHTRVLGKKPAFYQFTALMCRLVLVPQSGMDVEVAGV